MIDLEQLRKLSPQHGDVFVLPADTPPETAKALAEALHLAAPGIKAVVLLGDIQQLSVAAMNAAGWYRA